MEKKRLEQFKKRLEVRQQELRRLVSRNVQDGRAADEQAAQDVADKAANSYTKEFLFGQTHNDRSLLQMIDAALMRIREGSYGECAQCHEEMQQKRLEAVPWAKHCISCQQKQEQGLL
jgi:DnaK suppressor protein